LKSAFVGSFSQTESFKSK